MPFVQRSFDDLGAPLWDVTFVVVDLETTGTSPQTCEITEVGAVKLRGGECLGTLQTLVNPGLPIPPAITYLTGITSAMVMPAPRIDVVLPTLLEFIAGSVIVGHNVRFDLAFLQASLARAGYGRLANSFVDTCALARRLIREEVTDCRLATLATHFRTATRPTHRALDDARATGEVLHGLLERAGTLGVLALDDLLALPTVRGHPQLSKLKLVAPLPRQPGVYLFRDAGGRVLYVGKATDIRRRVRSYFTGDERRKVGQLLREVATIDHVVCNGTLEAAVLEVRLIHQLLPRFNRQAKLWRRYAYVKLTLDERWPRLAVVRAARSGDGCLYLGPLPSAGAARLVAEAIETAVPLRRCRARVPSTPRPAPCTSAQLGVAPCPCAGGVCPAEYAQVVDSVVQGVTTSPELLLDPLEARMRALAATQRFEEAAELRDRAAALSRALHRQHRFDALVRAGRLVIEEPGGEQSQLDQGRLVCASVSSPSALFPSIPLPSMPSPSMSLTLPVSTDVADELACVASWLDARASRLRVIDCDGGLAWPSSRLPRFEPAAQSVSRSRR
jgi:DNA polymerase III subunit epsilon